jgi:hypothetical protein
MAKKKNVNEMYENFFSTGHIHKKKLYSGEIKNKKKNDNKVYTLRDLTD